MLALGVLASGATMTQAGDGYIGIYADSAGTIPCTTVPQYSQMTLYVIAKLEGESSGGISGAEFRIEVENPSGWIFNYTAPPANIAIGDPMDLSPQNPGDGSGLRIAFGSCREAVDGQVPMGTVWVGNITGASTRLFVKRHSVPSNPTNFECALFTLCDETFFSSKCMTLTGVQSCSLAVATGKASAPVLEEDDPVVFTAALEGEEPTSDLRSHEGYTFNISTGDHFEMIQADIDNVPPGGCAGSPCDPQTVDAAVLAWVGIDNNMEETPYDLIWAQAGWIILVDTNAASIYYEFRDGNHNQRPPQFAGLAPSGSTTYKVEKSGDTIYLYGGGLIATLRWGGDQNCGVGCNFDREPGRICGTQVGAEMRVTPYDYTPGAIGGLCYFRNIGYTVQHSSTCTSPLDGGSYCYAGVNLHSAHPHGHVVQETGSSFYVYDDLGAR